MFNAIPWEVLMSSTKCEGLSYPTSRSSVIGIIFLTIELNKPHSLRVEMIFMQCSFQIKQNIYSLGIFRAPVVTQFIAKV